MKRLASIIVAGSVAAAAPAAAQNTAARAAAEQRYQIGQMERVLEGAVEHGLTNTRDRVQTLAQAPADLLVSENAHARGFRLEGYGVFFDVVVPTFETTLTWSLRTLDQNDLGVESALRTLQAHVNGKEVVVGPGSVLFYASMQPHAVQNVGDTPATYFVINWASPGSKTKQIPKPPSGSAAQ